MYAIIQTGGKQYRVSKGDVLEVELLDPKVQKVEFPEVYLVSNGRDSVIGRPVVAGARVTGTVLGTGRHPKVLVFKKKRRKHYKRTIGHRQYYTAVRIEEIDAAGAVEPLAEETAVQAAQRRKAPAPKKKAPKRKAPARKKRPTKKAPARKKAPVRRKKTPTRKAPARKKTAKKKVTRKATTRKSTKKKTGRS